MMITTHTQIESDQHTTTHLLSSFSNMTKCTKAISACIANLGGHVKNKFKMLASYITHRGAQEAHSVNPPAQLISGPAYSVSTSSDSDFTFSGNPISPQIQEPAKNTSVIMPKVNQLSQSTAYSTVVVDVIAQL